MKTTRVRGPRPCAVFKIFQARSISLPVSGSSGCVLARVSVVVDAMTRLLSPRVSDGLNRIVANIRAVPAALT